MKLFEGTRLEGVSAGKVAAAAVLGVTASGCVYLLLRPARGRAQAVRITSPQELRAHTRLRAWLPLGPGGAGSVTAVVLPNLGVLAGRELLGICSLSYLTQLSLPGCGIVVLPPQLSALRHLEDLDLARNPLSSLPESIGQLPSLKYLNLMACGLEALPPSIGQLSRLYRLGLKTNRLRSLPREIGQLSSLVELFITDNLLESLPAEMGQLTKLVKCQASFNEHLNALPAEMGALPELELLRMACCDIHELPPSFAGLPKLAWLSLASNPLTGAAHPSFSAAHLPLVAPGELEMGSKLGEGASGEVFASTWRGNEVAVKIFQAEKSPDGHSRDEMAIAVSLSHCNLIRILAVLEQPLGLVMELVRGKPLAEKPNFQSLLRCRWAPGRTFSLDFVLSVATGLAAALEHMHYQGVAHGDVYAHNLLADEEGNVWLCDYGASFFYKKGGPMPFEAQEVRAYGLLLNDMVQRLDVPFEGMAAVLSAQKQLLQLVQSCVSAPPMERPCFGAVGRELKAINKVFSQEAGRATTPPATTPATTPPATPRG